MDTPIQFSFKTDATAPKEVTDLYWDLFQIIADRRPDLNPGDTLEAHYNEAGWMLQIVRQVRIEKL